MVCVGSVHDNMFIIFFVFVFFVLYGCFVWFLNRDSCCVDGGGSEDGLRRGDMSDDEHA